MKNTTRKWACLKLAAALCTTVFLSTAAEPRARARTHSHQLATAQSDQPVRAGNNSETRRRRAPRSLEGLMLVEERTGSVVISNNIAALFNPASNIKIPTSLWALRTWGPDYRFTTEVHTTGTINVDGVLDGDLYVSGRYMLFGEKQARELARLLAGIGINSVKGSLYVTTDFSMDLRTTGEAAGDRLMAMLDPHHKTPALRNESGLLPDGTPEIAIAGSVKVGSAPAAAALLATHNAPPLKDVLKIMLCHSDNNMAERFGVMLGGPDALRTFVIDAIGIDAAEVQLASTSGLFVNRLSPRAMMKILKAFQAELKEHQLSLTDLLAVAGVDAGTLQRRLNGAGRSVTGKTGTLPETDNGVSTLAGELNTTREGTFLFVIFHMHGDVHRFRQRQDRIVSGFQRDHSGPRAFVYKPILPRIESEDFWN
ncbi:MAG: D-alanyl-D-alanine carboxypeptidase [Candidatus Melainabacteria bacterium]|nr:D-alanyl-D-alanine carboxypeptidase [Candidatus Melainabacteria bacterium]